MTVTNHPASVISSTDSASVVHGRSPGNRLVSATAAGPAPTSEWTDVPSLGVRVHARTWPGGGAGQPPVVLVHGLALSSRYLVPLGKRLAALGHEVLAPDLPGFGRTRRPKGSRWPAGPNVAEQTEQLLAWLNARGVERAVFFGNSIGSQVAVELAVRAPERVAGLVLEGATPDPAYRRPLRQYRKVARNMPFEQPSLLPVFQLEYASAGIPRMVQQLRRTVDDPIEQRLPRVQAPTLVLRGRNDQTLSQQWAEEFTRLVPNAALVVIEGAAHNAHWTAPHVTARVVELFLAGGVDAVRAAGPDVVPGPDAGTNPLAPRQPMPLAAKGVGGWATAGLCLAAPTLVGCGTRTARLLRGAGVATALNCAVADAPFGVLRKAPVPVHLNIEAQTGIQLMLAAATRLRGEPPAGRVLVAAIGAYQVLAVNLTRTPMGPARVVQS